MHRRFTTFPGWAIWPMAISGLLIGAALFLYRDSLSTFSQVNASTVYSSIPETPPATELGPRLQLTYEQWVALLEREAKVAAESHPKRLIVLAGDSISLWFPPELLPIGLSWLNQGISGETSAGLLQRLELFDQTKPETILVMIGINDLIHGVREETLLANHREVIRHLKSAHPTSKIVLQSILPHAGSRFVEQLRSIANGDLVNSPPLKPWVSRLAIVPNHYIRELNQELATIAKEEKVGYLDLHAYFTDAEGNIQPALSTDGLHLSRRGYEVWRTHLLDFSRSPSRRTAAKKK